MSGEAKVDGVALAKEQAAKIIEQHRQLLWKQEGNPPLHAMQADLQTFASDLNALIAALSAHGQTCATCKWGLKHERSYPTVAACQREEWDEVQGGSRNPCYGHVVFNRGWDFGGCRFHQPAPPTMERAR